MRLEFVPDMDADSPIDDLFDEDPGDDTVVETSVELLALLKMGLLCKYVIHSGSHQACKSLHHSQTGLFGMETFRLEKREIFERFFGGGIGTVFWATEIYCIFRVVIFHFP